MTKRYLITVAILGMWAMLMIIFELQVLLGRITPENLIIFNLAVAVQLFQTAALLAMTFMNRYVSRSNLRASYYFFVVGTVLFSGSLYLIATEEITKLIIGIMGKVSLLGAVVLLVGWFIVLFTGATYKHKKRAIHNQ
ncbi:MAG: DUF423 domain-containing protein [Chlorobi bacterium]|nr:DUF423 domain-containing protein [Chlorobiota bacterium]